MSNITQRNFAKDSWQTPRNARTLRAFMALQHIEMGTRIAQLRADRGNPPQEVVAAQLGVSYRSYQAWEAGETKPGFKNMEKLAELYEVPIEYILMGGAKAPTPEAALNQLDKIQGLLVEALERIDGLEAALAERPTRSQLEEIVAGSRATTQFFKDAAGGPAADAPESEAGSGTRDATDATPEAPPAQSGGKRSSGRKRAL